MYLPAMAAPLMEWVSRENAQPQFGGRADCRGSPAPREASEHFVGPGNVAEDPVPLRIDPEPQKSALRVVRAKDDGNLAGQPDIADPVQTCQDAGGIVDLAARL